MKKLNLNSAVKVKLTPLGVEKYYHRFNDLNKKIEMCGGKKIEPSMPEIDKDGFTEFQLWHFIELFGKHIGLGKENVISEMNFYIPEDDLEEVKVE